MTEDDADQVFEESPCAECGGKCCSFRDGAISYRELDHGQRYDSLFLNDDSHAEQLLFEDGEVPDMKWFVVDHGGYRNMAFHCPHRDEDGKCGEYDRRPTMCQTFQCPVLEGDETLDEFLDYFDRPDGVPDDADVTEVTERVQEILRRKADDGVEPGGPNE